MKCSNQGNQSVSYYDMSKCLPYIQSIHAINYNTNTLFPHNSIILKILITLFSNISCFYTTSTFLTINSLFICTLCCPSCAGLWLGTKQHSVSITGRAGVSDWSQRSSRQHHRFDQSVVQSTKSFIYSPCLPTSHQCPHVHTNTLPNTHSLNRTCKLTAMFNVGSMAAHSLSIAVSHAHIRLHKTTHTGLVFQLTHSTSSHTLFQQP